MKVNSVNSVNSVNMGTGENGKQEKKFYGYTLAYGAKGNVEVKQPPISFEDALRRANEQRKMIDRVRGK